MQIKELLTKAWFFFYIKWICRTWQGTIRFVIIGGMLAGVLMMMKGCSIGPDGLIIGEIDCEAHTLCEEG